MWFQIKLYWFYRLCGVIYPLILVYYSLQFFNSINIYMLTKSMTRKLKGGSKGPGKRPGKRPGKAPGKAPGKTPSLKDLHKLTKDLKKIKKKPPPKLSEKEKKNVTEIQKQLASKKLQRELTRGIVGSINAANVLDELNKEKELQGQLRMRRAEEEERRRAEEERLRLQEEMRRIADIENASKMAEMGNMFDNFDLNAQGIRRTRRKRNRKRTRRKKPLPGNRRHRRNASSRRKSGRRKSGRR